jgi:DNA-directed RNA polymerase subunit RPC12/RpoP
MDVQFKCWKCEQSLSADESSAGAEIVCPSCNSAVIVPAPAAPPSSGGFKPRGPERVLVPKAKGNWQVEHVQLEQPPGAPLRVVVTDIDIPFGSVFLIVLRWFMATVLLGIILGLIYLAIVMVAQTLK